MENFTYYVFALVAIIIGFFIVKKVATCLIKALVTIIVIAVIAAAYWLYFS